MTKGRKNMEPEESLWFVEPYTKNLRFEYRVRKVIWSGETKYQKVDLIDIYAFGKSLFLDGKLQSAEIDEKVYHEALVHPAMFIHPEPKKVLIAGGGEGATLREVLRHNTVEKATMVDIDGELVEICKKMLPEWSDGAFEDCRAEVIIGDAREYVFNTKEKYDVFISDLTEPVEGGPSIQLYTLEFLQKVFEILNDSGIYVAQAGSADPIYPYFVSHLSRTLKELFPYVEVYSVFIFSFQLNWAFVLASKKINPTEVKREEIKNRIKERGLKDFRFFRGDMLPGLFFIPVYLQELIEEKGEVLRDGKPFIWKA